MRSGTELISETQIFDGLLHARQSGVVLHVADILLALDTTPCGKFFAPAKGPNIWAFRTDDALD